MTIVFPGLQCDMLAILQSAAYLINQIQGDWEVVIAYASRSLMQFQRRCTRLRCPRLDCPPAC